MAERLFIFAFWAALAFTSFNAFAPPEMVTAPRVSDIVLHAVAFSVLTFLLQLAHLPRRPLLAASLMLGYGLFIEAVQYGLGNREAELKDFVIDLLGIGLGVLGFRLLGTWTRQTAVGWFGTSES